MSLNYFDPFAHGAYLLWTGGSLKLDLIEDETTERDADIVEHPVEVGSPVVDHYRLRLNTIKLSGFVSQEPVDPSLYPEASGSVQPVTYNLPAYPSRLVQNVVTGIIDPTSVANLLLAQSPPTVFVDSVLQYANPVDTLAKVLGALEDLRKNATLVDVATRGWYYAQHLVGRVTTRRNFSTGTGTIIDLELKQVLFVSTQAVAAPPTPVQKKDAPAVEKGKQNPTPFLPSSLSVLGLKSLGFFK